RRFSMNPAKTAGAWALAGLALALTACDVPADRRAATPGASAPPQAIKEATNSTAPPPLPVVTDVDAATAAKQIKSSTAPQTAQPDKDGADQALNVAAQDAAAKAPDTATGDEAKKQVVESGTTAAKSDSGGPSDELSPADESAKMPKPGQANDHSAIK